MTPELVESRHCARAVPPHKFEPLSQIWDVQGHKLSAVIITWLGFKASKSSE